MLQICDVALPAVDAFALVDMLERVGRADDVTAAYIIERAVDRDELVAPLTQEERLAVLSVLDDPPSPCLAELRGVLARDHRDRN